MPQYSLRDLPSELWRRFTERAHAERWPLRALLLQLMDDYASGTVHPTSGPPHQNPEYAWLLPYYRRLAQRSDFLEIDDLERWHRLVDEVQRRNPTNLPVLSVLPVDVKLDILQWLDEAARHYKPSPSEHRLDVRAIAHIGEGPSLMVNRRPIQYEVTGLPPGQQAWIADFGTSRRGSWRILRANNGVQGHWEENHDSAKSALRALEQHLDAELGSP